MRNTGRARSVDSSYRQAACDELLAEEICGSDEHQRVCYEDAADQEDREPLLEVLANRGQISEEVLSSTKRRARQIRAIALICTCSLSIGSH